MKKFFSILLCVVLVIVGTTVSVTAATTEEPDITPLYNNTTSANLTLKISSSGMASINLSCIGISGVTTKITAVTYLQRKVGLIWVKVDNGLTDKEWVDTVYATKLSKVHSLQLEKTGTYRVKTVFTVYGSGGSADEIECSYTATY